MKVSDFQLKDANTAVTNAVEEVITIERRHQGFTSPEAKRAESEAMAVFDAAAVELQKAIRTYAAERGASQEVAK
jgi:hypothetical protein